MTSMVSVSVGVGGDHPWTHVVLQHNELPLAIECPKHFQAMFVRPACPHPFNSI